jgi:membrane protein
VILSFRERIRARAISAAERLFHLHPVLVWLRDLVVSASTHSIVERAATTAYFLLFAVFPFLVAILGLLSLFDLTAEVVILEELLADAFPGVVAEMLVSEVHRVAFAEAGGRIFLGFAVSVYASQRAIAMAIRGVNAAWGQPEDDRSYLVVRSVGLVITLATMGSALVAVLLLTGGHYAIAWVTDHGWIDQDLGVLLQWVRWPVVLLMLHGVINLIFRFGANTPLAWSWSTWGSLAATGGIVLVTLSFQVYVESVTDLGATYGSLGAAIGLLLYFYGIAGVVFLGAEIDALNYRRRKEKDLPEDDRIRLLV